MAVTASRKQGTNRRAPYRERPRQGRRLASAAALAALVAGCGARTAAQTSAPPSTVPANAPAAPPPELSWTELGGSLSPLSGHDVSAVGWWDGAVVALWGSRIWAYQSGAWSALPPLPSPTSNLDPSAVAAAGSELWVGAYGFAAYNLGTEAWTASYPASGPPIVSTMAANVSGVVVAVPEGVGSPWEWRDGAWARLSGLASALSGGFSHAAAVSSGGTVVVGTSSGVWEETAGGAWTPLGGSSNALATHSIDRLAISSGVVAAYGTGVGVVEYTGGSWQALTPEPAGIASGSVGLLGDLFDTPDPLAFSPAGALTVGTASGGIWTYSTSRGWSAMAHLGSAVQSLAYLPTGVLVASTAGGVYTDGSA